MSDLFPLDWPTTTIKSSSYLKGRIGWQGLRASEFLDEGPYLITGTNFRDGQLDWSNCYHVSDKRFAEAPDIHVRDGDVLITKDGTIGKIAFVNNCPARAVLNSGVFLLRCADGSYDHKFVYHLLRSHLFERFLRLSLNGSTINHLFQNVFERFAFPVPSRGIQLQIASIVDAIDRQIRLTESLIAKYQQIKAGLMHDLFTRGLDANGQLRPAREEAPGLYKKSGIGWVPRDWGIVTLQECAAVERGKFTARPRDDPRFYGGTYPFIQTGDVTACIGRLLVEHSQTLNDCGRMVSKEFPANTVMVTIAANIADTCILGVPMCAPDSVVGAVPRPGENSKFLELCVRWRKPFLEARAPQSAQKNINLEDLRPLLIPRPSPRERDGIAERCEAMDGELQMMEEESAKFKALKNGLMQDLLTGRVRVKVEKSEAKAASV